MKPDGKPINESVPAASSPSWLPWSEAGYRWLGLASAVTFFLCGYAADSVWLRAGMWTAGADLFLIWVVEHVEQRRGGRLLAARKALLLLWPVALLLLAAGMLGW